MKKHPESSSSMGKKKMWVEVCLISARGLPRYSLWKLQWYAVGWIDPNDKYCTNIDASGNPNPMWKTKFSTSVHVSESDLLNLVLQVEVYSREPLFLGEKLRGTATISLKEFLANHTKNSSESEGLKQGNEDVGSFQLRKRNSDKPQGFIDVSIRISEEKEGTSSYSHLGSEEGFNLRNSNNSIKLATDAGPIQPHHPSWQAEPPQFHLPGKTLPPLHYPPYTHPMSYPTNYPNPNPNPNPNPSICGPSYPPPPPPPPPPSNVGYMPTFLPRTDIQPGLYMNMPSSGVGAGRGGGPGFAAGLGAGALAAGAVMFGGDLMSGFELPAGIRHPSLVISTDPPF